MTTDDTESADLAPDFIPHEFLREFESSSFNTVRRSRIARNLELPVPALVRIRARDSLGFIRDRERWSRPLLICAAIAVPIAVGVAPTAQTAAIDISRLSLAIFVSSLGMLIALRPRPGVDVSRHGRASTQ